jgi:hypothetical protein
MMVERCGGGEESSRKRQIHCFSRYCACKMQKRLLGFDLSRGQTDISLEF